MRTVRTALIIAMLTTACGKEGTKESGPATTSTQEAAKPTATPVTAEFFGKTVSPPGTLAKLTWGMPEAEVRAKAPELTPNAKSDFQLSKAPGLEGVSYAVGFDEKTKDRNLSRMYVQLPASAAALIATAWGKGKDAKDSIGRPRTYWFDAATGWRAHTEKGFGDAVNLELTKYLPAEKLLGEGPEALGFAPQGILGASLEDLRTRFATQLVETDAKKAAEDQAKLAKFAGKDLDKVLGAAKPNVRVDLAPTEWGQFWTRVNLTWDDAGKVSEVWFKLPFEAYPGAKDELKAMLDKKWGAPKEIEKYGRKQWLYREKAPRVTVAEDTISHGWDVRLSNATQD